MRRDRVLIVLIAAFFIIAPAALAQVKPQQPAPVPNVEGMSLTAAQKDLVSAGFNAVVTYENVTDPGKNNVVLKQQIPSGKTLAKGSSVPVVVGRYTAPATTPVPGVMGKPLAEAQKTLAASKLNAVVSMETVTDPAKNNVVLRQQTAPGTALAPGSQVQLVVGRYTPPAQVKVPYVTGKPLAEAQKTLVEAKLNAEVTMQPVAEPHRNSVVIGQKVAAGTPLAPGSMVPLIVGKYTPPARVNVPNVTGMPLAEAQKALVAAKLNAEVTMQPVTQPQQNDKVLSQKFSVGTPLAPGSMVPLVVGKYTAPATLPVPSVTGKPLAEAQKALAANKLNATVSMEAVTDPAKNNVVLKQQVAPGTALAPGSQVPLIVGKYTAPAMLPVPSVTGKPLAEAQKALATNKLNAVVSMEKVTDKSRDNIVLKQQVAPGTTLAPGSQVPLVVGKYVEPVRVPSIVGMTEKQAETSLKQANLKINAGGRTVTNQRQVGTVLDQNPAPGTAVEPGSQVMVTMGLKQGATVIKPKNNPYYPYNPPIEPDAVNTK